MEAENRSRCVICSVPSSASVELVRETFSASRTLEKTLEMLWGRFTDSKVDSKKIFEGMGGKRGNLFCFPCLAVLHAGMGLVSVIMQLEERLRNLIGKITVDGAKCTKDHTPSMKSTQQYLAKQEREMIPKKPKRDFDCTGDETSETHDNESQNSGKILWKTTKKRMRGNYFEEDSWNPTKRHSIKNKPMKKESASSAPLQSKSGPKTRRTRKGMKIYGVENCPSCDYEVDVRTPEQAATSSDSLSRSVQSSLFVKSRYQLSKHFQDVHLCESGVKTFTQMNSSGREMFKCIECPFITSDSHRVVQHYISFHVRKRPKPVSTGRSNLSCPEKGCSFVSVGVKSGCTWSPDADLRMRINLSSHVIRHHDRLSLTARKLKVNSTLLVDTKDNNKEYQCTRCEYTKAHPKNLTASQSGICRRIFLRHFFDVHLREMISNL